ncbi:MAG: dihydroneopterin aldolase [Alphaproteobacteria bacterium]
MTQPKLLRPSPIADARAGLRHVFVRDLLVSCRIGVHRHEKRIDQPVRINLDLAVSEGSQPLRDRLGDVLDYEEIVERVRRIAGRGHINLLETLAERIAGACLEDARVRSARVRVEKLDVFPDAASVGVEIERHAGGRKGP